MASGEGVYDLWGAGVVMEDEWAAIEQAELEGMERDDMREEYQQEIEVLRQKDEAHTDARARRASEIESLTAEVERLREANAKASDDALTQFSINYHAAYGCDPVMMYQGRENWRFKAERLQVELDRANARLKEYSERRK